MSYNIPGAFPRDVIEGSSRQESNQEYIKSSATEILEEESNAKFDREHIITRKTKYQRDLIMQLEALVYLLIGYQFIKYCHSACLIPLALHISVQVWLSCKTIIKGNSNESSMSIVDIISRFLRSIEDPVMKEELIRSVTRKFCLFIYWKSIFTFVYHIVFVCFWEVPLIKSNGLDTLENGWWVISFIGEEAPRYLQETDNYWKKLFGLGLHGLLFTDLLITFIQLTLFQSIFKQSTAINKERVLNEKEIYILRQSNETTSVVDNTISMDNETPAVFAIRLFDSLKVESF